MNILDKWIKFTYSAVTWRALLIKSFAISVTFSNKSSGKFKLHCDMFRNVSCFVSPPNGLKPLKRT